MKDKLLSVGLKKTLGRSGLTLPDEDYGALAPYRHLVKMVSGFLSSGFAFFRMWCRVPFGSKVGRGASKSIIVDMCLIDRYIHHHSDIIRQCIYITSDLDCCLIALLRSPYVFNSNYYHMLTFVYIMYLKILKQCIYILHPQKTINVR